MSASRIERRYQLVGVSWSTVERACYQAIAARGDAALPPRRHRGEGSLGLGIGTHPAYPGR
ncbi:MAG: hypothetical protein M3460_29570 [Actinomycetota bacterium]|nr:hypothetical protein [Actinomycetota bacterium]